MSLLPIIATMNGTTPGGGGTPPSTDKSIQRIEDIASYEAFGSPCKVTDNHVVYVYRRAADHLTGGDIYYRVFNISTFEWSDGILLISDAEDCRDAWISPQLINDRVIVTTSTYISGTDTTTSLFFQKFSVNTSTGELTADGSRAQITGVNGVEELQRGTCFGPVTTADNGKHYVQLHQWEGSRVKIDCLEFTSDMSSWTAYNVKDDTDQYYEAPIIVCPSGKFIMPARLELGGTLETWESSDYGHTWTYKNRSNLYHFIEGNSSMCYGLYNNGNFHIIACIRDARMIVLSPGNTIAENFGNSTVVYKGPEIFAYNKSFDLGNVALGYPSFSLIDPDYGTYGLWLCVWTREYSSDKANLFWCVTDFETDPSGVPAAPPTITISSIDSDGFRFDIEDYTDDEIANIRHLEFDIATDAGFTTFASGKYRNTSVFTSNSTLQNINIVGLWSVINGLSAGTYYLRIRAKNNAGNSSYTSTSITIGT